MTLTEELLSKVKAGAWDCGDAVAALNEERVDQDFGRALGAQMYRGYHAYCGSLDAAKALHEAVLPEWSWQVNVLHRVPRGAVWLGSTGDGDLQLFQTDADTPARAWLIAILKALIAKEKADG